MRGGVWQDMEYGLDKIENDGQVSINGEKNPGNDLFIFSHSTLYADSNQSIIINPAFSWSQGNDN